MISKELIVKNEKGIHARPAALIVAKASEFQSDIFLMNDEYNANAKSIMNVLILAAEQGSTLLLKVEGSDEAEAVEAIEKLFESKFDDEKS